MKIVEEEELKNFPTWDVWAFRGTNFFFINVFLLHMCSRLFDIFLIFFIFSHSPVPLSLSLSPCSSVPLVLFLFFYMHVRSLTISQLPGLARKSQQLRSKCTPLRADISFNYKSIKESLSKNAKADGERSEASLAQETHFQWEFLAFLDEYEPIINVKHQ